MKTQGTQLYAIDPTDDSVIEVFCVISIDGIDSQIEQRETTCLADDARTFEAGLANPGNATFGIRTDPQDTSHVRLHQLKKAGTTLHWALGWADGTNIPPTVDSNGTFNLPATRSWLTFDGYLSAYPFSFQQNASVESQLAIQVSGDPEWIQKTA